MSRLVRLVFLWICLIFQFLHRFPMSERHFAEASLSLSLGIPFGKGVWDLSFLYTLNILIVYPRPLFLGWVSLKSTRNLNCYQEGNLHCQVVQFHKPCFFWNQTLRCWSDEHQQFCRCADRLQINVHPNSFPSTRLFDKFRHSFFPKCVSLLCLWNNLDQNPSIAIKPDCVSVHQTPHSSLEVVGKGKTRLIVCNQASYLSWFHNKHFTATNMCVYIYICTPYFPGKKVEVFLLNNNL